jgi:hypothetical protein
MEERENGFIITLFRNEYANEGANEGINEGAKKSINQINIIEHEGANEGANEGINEATIETIIGAIIVAKNVQEKIMRLFYIIAIKEGQKRLHAINRIFGQYHK